MKFIAPLSGFASSLCLSVGLLRAAEKLDPVSHGAAAARAAAEAHPAQACLPCNFTARTGR